MARNVFKQVTGRWFSASLLVIFSSAELTLAADSLPLFQETDLLQLKLTGPVSSTIEDRQTRTERPFVIEAGDHHQDVMLRVRGKSRSQKKACSFPPIRLRFESASGVFAGQDEIKLVTHCRNSSKGDANAMEEFAAYRIFNLFSPVSLRVRPVQISWSDSEGRLDEDAQHRFGFLIEPRDQLAARTGGTQVETPGIRLSTLDGEQAALVYVFQYLIGNTDWSLVAGEGEQNCCHNGVLLDIESQVQYVPYDFDLSGLVNAVYAKPDPSLKLRNVRARRYRGFCTQPEILFDAVNRSIELEEDVYEVIRSAPALSDKDRKADIKYLQDYYEKVKNREKLITEFEKRCLEP